MTDPGKAKEIILRNLGRVTKRFIDDDPEEWAVLDDLRAGRLVLVRGEAEPARGKGKGRGVSKHG